MKNAIVYSSKTGNTKKVAEAIAQVVEDGVLMPVTELQDYTAYDRLIIGYWVDKGMPDEASLELIKRVHHKEIIFFGTLGASPESKHASSCIAKAEAIVLEEGKGNTVLGSWLCLGKIDPKLLEMMAKMAPATHTMTEERKARIEEANKHPDAQDCLNGQKFVLECLAKAS